MKIMCDYENKRFATGNCDDRNAETCVAMLNDAVSVQQIVNLSFDEVAFELRERRVHFAVTEDNDLTIAVQSAVDNMFEKTGSTKIHCMVLLIAGGADLTLEKANDALQNMPQRLPDGIIFYGIKIDESLTGTNKVFLIVSE